MKRSRACSQEGSERFMLMWCGGGEEGVDGARVAGGDVLLL
jgi:hypothetical protein